MKVRYFAMIFVVTLLISQNGNVRGEYAIEVVDVPVTILWGEFVYSIAATIPSPFIVDQEYSMNGDFESHVTVGSGWGYDEYKYSAGIWAVSTNLHTTPALNASILSIANNLGVVYSVSASGTSALSLRNSDLNLAPGERLSAYFAGLLYIKACEDISCSSSVFYWFWLVLPIYVDNPILVETVTSTETTTNTETNTETVTTNVTIISSETIEHTSTEVLTQTTTETIDQSTETVKVTATENVVNTINTTLQKSEASFPIVSLIILPLIVIINRKFR